MNQHESNLPNEAECLREDWVIVGRVDANGKRYDDVEQRHEVSISANGAVVQKGWIQEREYGCGHDARRPRGGRGENGGGLDPSVPIGPSRHRGTGEGRYRHAPD